MNELVQCQRNKKYIYQLPRPFNVHSCYVARGMKEILPKVTEKYIYVLYPQPNCHDLELTHRNLIQNNRSIPCVNNKTFHGKQIKK